MRLCSFDKYGLIIFRRDCAVKLFHSHMCVIDLFKKIICQHDRLKNGISFFILHFSIMNEIAHFFMFFKRFYLFLEIWKGKEREAEQYQCVVVSHIPPTGDLACNPGMCPDWESNR